MKNPKTRLQLLKLGYRPGESVSYFGRKTVWLARRGSGYAITKSRTVVYNDLIDQVLDVYQL